MSLVLHNDVLCHLFFIMMSYVTCLASIVHSMALDFGAVHLKVLVDVLCMEQSSKRCLACFKLHSPLDVRPVKWPSKHY